VGLALLKGALFELEVWQLIDTTTAFRRVASSIMAMNPATVIVCDSQHPDIQNINRAVEDVCEVLGIGLKTLKRSFFDDTRGMELIAQYCTVCSLDLLPSNYLAVGCAGAF
jgi:hypothetical protein